MLWFLFLLFFKTHTVVILTLNQSSIVQSDRLSYFIHLFSSLFIALCFFFPIRLHFPSFFLHFPSLSFAYLFLFLFPFSFSCLFFSCFSVRFLFLFRFLHNISSISFNRLSFSLFSQWRLFFSKKFAFPCFLTIFSIHCFAFSLVVPLPLASTYSWSYYNLMTVLFFSPILNFTLRFRAIIIQFSESRIVIIRTSVLSLRLIDLVFVCS